MGTAESEQLFYFLLFTKLISSAVEPKKIFLTFVDNDKPIQLSQEIKNNIFRNMFVSISGIHFELMEKR